MSAPDRQEMLDALGHGEGACVAHEHYAKAVAAYQAEAQRAEDAEDERDRYREALVSIVNPPPALSTDDPCELAQWAAETAHAALPPDTEATS